MNVKQIVGVVIGGFIGCLAATSLSQYWVSTGGIVPEWYEGQPAQVQAEYQYMVDGYTIAVTFIFFTLIFGTAGLAFCTDKVSKKY